VNEQAARPGRSNRRRGDRSEAVALPPVVGPGLSGGALKPLSETEADAVIGAAFDLLERVGMADTLESGQTALVAHGAVLGDDGRLRLPRVVVEKLIAMAPSDPTVFGYLQERDLQVGRARVHLGVGGAAVQVLDGATGHFRDSTALDLFDLARVVEACDNIHYYLRPTVARDMPDHRTLDINTAYACLAGTTKPIGTSFTAPETVDEVADLVAIATGCAFEARPACFIAAVHVVPPMRFASDGCLVMERAVARGMPVQICSAGQAGATSPAALAGALAQGLAECLAGICYVNAIRPGHPVISALMPFVSDLRTGAMTGGSGECAIASAAAVQLLARLNLPSTACAGMTDAKLPDSQSGSEKAMSVALTAHAGANMVNLSAGMLGSIMAASAEAFVIDNDMHGAILRTVRGIEVDSERLSVDIIDAVVHGEGHFLGTEQTMRLMKWDYLYPDLGDRQSIADWSQAGEPSLWDRAHQRVDTILSCPLPDHIPAEADQAIRERFPILLPQRGF
jgi:trimethylamine---corrinoid protein Co-methyltransferase